MSDSKYVMSLKSVEPEPLTPADAGVPMTNWGKDHWSVFLYIEDICVNSVVNGIGKPDLRRIQCNHNRHPGLVNWNYHRVDGAKYGIRLHDGTEMPGPDYDEWDCIHDLECYGLIQTLGTGINPLFRMTELGNFLASDIRDHKTKGGMLRTFKAGAEYYK